MGGMRGVIKAKTIGELRKKHGEEWRKARAKGLDPWSFDRSRVKKTEDGYEIEFYAHT